MDNKKIYDYVPLMIIGVLTLIIISLTIVLINSEIEIIAAWFPQSIFTGIFTLAGAFLGASYAGRYTLKSVNEQIKFEKEIRKEEEYKKSERSIRLINDELMTLLSTMGSLLHFLEKPETRDLQISLSRQVIEKCQTINTLLADTNLMTTISNQKFSYVMFLKHCTDITISLCESVQSDEYLTDMAEQETVKGILTSRKREIQKVYDKTRNQ